MRTPSRLYSAMSLLQPVERHVRAAALEQLAVVVGVERIDEAHLADRHAMRGGRRARGGCPCTDSV